MVEVAVQARAEVDGLHHAARGQDAQQRVEVGETVQAGPVQGVGQRLGRVRVDLYVLRAKGGKPGKLGTAKGTSRRHRTLPVTPSLTRTQLQAALGTSHL